MKATLTACNMTWVECEILQNKLLAKDPASFRLACQTAVERGDVTVRNKPDA